MSDDGKKVFISYRRALSRWIARTVYQYLTHNSYDVFMDVENIDSGEFQPIIFGQIEASPHFIIVLQPGSLERTSGKDDWLRREIEHALKKKRNIVPLLADGFTFDREEKTLPRERFPGKLGELRKHNAMVVSDDYFEAAMKKLTDRFLKTRANISIKSTPATEQPSVKRMILNALHADVDRSGKEWLWNRRSLLSAPKLERSLGENGQCVWKWTLQAGATGYVLQYGPDSSFESSGVNIYDGDKTEFKRHMLLEQQGYYRVRAKGGFAFLDSPWSNVVEVTAAQSFVADQLIPPNLGFPVRWNRPLLGMERPDLKDLLTTSTIGSGKPDVGPTAKVTPEMLFPEPWDDPFRTPWDDPFRGVELPDFKDLPTSTAGSGKPIAGRIWSSPNLESLEPTLATPKLESPSIKDGQRIWKWGPVWAKSFLLQKSSDQSFASAEDLYDGDCTEYAEKLGDFVDIRTLYYRVGARSMISAGNVFWSNLIEVQGLIYRFGRLKPS